MKVIDVTNMSKIVIPVDGISNKVSGSISKCKTALINAQNHTSYSVPSGFQYENFCHSLSPSISTYLKEINDISNKILEIEKKYNNLSDKTNYSVKSIPATIIVLHDRLIVKK